MKAWLRRSSVAAGTVVAAVVLVSAGPAGAQPSGCTTISSPYDAVILARVPWVGPLSTTMAVSLPAGRYSVSATTYDTSHTWYTVTQTGERIGVRIGGWDSALTPDIPDAATSVGPVDVGTVDLAAPITSITVFLGPPVPSSVVPLDTTDSVHGWDIAFCPVAIPTTTTSTTTTTTTTTAAPTTTGPTVLPTTTTPPPTLGPTTTGPTVLPTTTGPTVLPTTTEPVSTVTGPTTTRPSSGTLPETGPADTAGLLLLGASVVLMGVTVAAAGRSARTGRSR